MILIVSLSADHPSLQVHEYVMPIERAVAASGAWYRTLHRSELTPQAVSEPRAVILCGTAVGDNAVMDDVEAFGWLREHQGPVLGICAGANLLCRVYGGELEDVEEIGHVRLRGGEGEPNAVIGDLDGHEAYVTRVMGPVLPEGFRTLASSEAGVQAFVKEEGPVYGILFHPEVRHREIIARFCSLASDE